MEISTETLLTKADDLRYKLALRQDVVDDARVKMEKMEKDAKLVEQKLLEGRNQLSDMRKSLDESNQVRLELAQAWEASEEEVRHLQVQLEEREAQVALLMEMLHAGDFKKEVRPSISVAVFIILKITLSCLHIRTQKPAQRNPGNAPASRSSMTIPQMKRPARRARR